MFLLAPLLCPAGRAEIPVEVVAREVQQVVAERLALEPGDVEVPWLGLARALDCPADSVVHVQARPGETFVGHVDLRVYADSAEGRCADLRLRPRLVIWQNAVVAAATVDAGAQVPLAIARVRRADLQSPTVSSTSGPWEARVPIDAGAPVLRAAVRPVPAARGGDEVTILVDNHGLRIEAPGRLLRDAQLGDRVRVSNLATHTVVEGVLVAPQRIEIGGL